MRRDLIILAAVLITSLLCSCGRDRRGEVTGGNKVVHLSIDDVEVFGDLIRHQQDYDSLFQHPFMAFLQELHSGYGMRVTLYTYESFGDIYRDDSTRIEDMPQKYKSDFRRASDWLRIGFHSPRAKFDSIVTVTEFRDSYNNVNSAIARFADSSMIASTLRLHYFFAPDSLLKVLTGVRTLLCADDKDRLSYNLTASEAKSVWNRASITKNDISYIRTDLRIDGNPGVLDDLRHPGNGDTLVVFTHEWELWHNPETDSTRGIAGKIKILTSECVNKVLFKETVKRLYEYGYDFSFLE